MNFIKKYFKKEHIEDRNKVCVIVVNCSDDNIKRVEKRISTIQTEILFADIDKVVVYDIYNKVNVLNKNFVVFNSKDKLIKYIKNTNVLLTTDSQFAISKDVISDMLTEQKTNSVVTLEDTENLITNSPLFGNFILLPSENIKSIIDNLNQNSFFEDKLLPETFKIKLTNEIIQHIYKNQAKRILPTTITLESSNRCNQSCSFCAYHGKPQKDQWRYIDDKKQCDMGLVRFEELVKEISEWEDEYISLWDRTIVPYRRGEFLIDPNFKEICSIIKKYNFRLFFVTNASLLKKEETDFLLDIGIDHIKISRHGVSKKAIESNNLSEYADRAEKNILYFLNEKKKRDINCYAGLTFTITEGNVHEQDIFLETWKDYVDYIDMSPENYNCDLTKSKKFKEEYLFFKPNTSLRVPCKGLMYNIWVNSDYNMLPCIGGIRESIGSCENMPILDVLHNSDFMSNLIEAHCDGSFVDRESCRDCQQYYADYVVAEDSIDLLTQTSPVMKCKTFK